MTGDDATWIVLRHSGEHFPETGSFGDEDEAGRFATEDEARRWAADFTLLDGGSWTPEIRDDPGVPSRTWVFYEVISEDALAEREEERYEAFLEYMEPYGGAWAEEQGRRY